MSQIKLFTEKAQSDPVLMEKLNDMCVRDADAGEYVTLAAEHGFSITEDEINSMKSRPLNCEVSEEDLEKVSGGGSGLAACMFVTAWLSAKVVPNASPLGKVKKIGNDYWRECPSQDTWICNWFMCRCCSTSHCKDYWHKCNENGDPIFGHEL